MVAVYGLKFILAGLILAIIGIFGGLWQESTWIIVIGFVFSIVTLFLVFFYRNPIRRITTEDGTILSIADGRVLSVEEIENEYIGGKCKKVSIFLSVLNVHVNRVPIDGIVDYAKYNPGKFFQAFRDKASSENEQTEIGLNYGSGKMIFKQIAGIMARRIEYDLNDGQKVRRGDIFGMIHFGSRAELFLPPEVDIKVIRGQKVKGGLTVIGKINE
jgi:phosphatidylserine decarboxylase